MKRGTILFHTKFQFKNGDIGEKLIAILNEPDPAKEPFLICRTTSQQKGKSTNPGCQADLSMFYLSANSDFFEKGTWIQLYEIYEVEVHSFLKDHFDGNLKIMGELKDGTIKSLLKCIAVLQDISPRHRKMILGK